jgi:hypothetical protein
LQFDGVLVVRQAGADGSEAAAVYAADGRSLGPPPVPFAKSLASAVVGMQEPCAMNDLAGDSRAFGAVELQPFEKDRRSLLAAPVRVGQGVHVVLELFDKQPANGSAGGFTADDRRLVAAVADFGAELLRHALAERQTHNLLFDAIGAALAASNKVSQTMEVGGPSAADPPLPADVMSTLRRGLETDPNAVVGADASLRLAEAVRELAVRHGPAAVEHCTRLVGEVRELLDRVTGAADLLRE